MRTTFTIIKGEPLEFTIIVKASGTVTPLVLDVSDTFTYTLTDKKQRVKYAENVPMTISDANAGKVLGTIPIEVTTVLPTKYASSEDYFVRRPVLMLVISGNTLAQGAMTAFIDNVYVVEG